jgi:uncharacterized protein (TIGR02145 family)
MKTKLLFSLVLLATLGMVSCKKDKEELDDHTAVTIGDKVYPTTVIGNQVWMTENYSGNGGIYYQHNNAHRLEYGKYYTLAEAKAIAVPQGWRLPTKEDFKKLLETQGATWQEDGANFGITDNVGAIQKLLATTQWPDDLGTNASGFNALPNGYADEDGVFLVQGFTSYFWTSTTTASDNHPLFFHLVQAEGDGYAEYTDDQWPMDGVRMCVRFVKDKN